MKSVEKHVDRIVSLEYWIENQWGDTNMHSKILKERKKIAIIANW